jgi:peptidoglycan/LPS O-acetylase OafA/YrhL
MTSAHVAGGPLGVARTDRPPRNRRERRPLRRPAAGLVAQVLAGAVIVLALAVATLGPAAGTAVVVLLLAALGLTLVLAAGRRKD